ncbi:MAG: hypothetical protein AAF821_00170 [Cyanobacteria bacterium P01_D01_bin.156]
MLLLQVAPNLSLQDTQIIFETVSSSFDQIVTDLFTKQGIFTALVTYGRVISLGASTFWIVQWSRKVASGQEAMSKLVWPLVCVILFSNQGKPLAAINLGARSIVNQITTGILSETVNGLKLQTAMSQALAQGSAAQFGALAQRACADLSEGERIQCLEDYDAQLQQQLKQLQRDKDSEAWYSGITQYLSIKKLKESLIGDLALTLELAAFSAVFYGIATVMVWTIEIALIIFMVTSPIAVGLSLLPVPGRPLIVWASTFIGIGMAKIGLITSNAIAASVVVSSSANLNTVLLPLFMALGAPVIATGLAVAAGGGTFLSIAAGPVASVSLLSRLFSKK